MGGEACALSGYEGDEFYTYIGGVRGALGMGNNMRICRSRVVLWLGSCLC